MEQWFEVWDSWDYGPYGNKACNLCYRHLQCSNEDLVFVRRARPQKEPYCISFKLSEKIKEELLRWNKVFLG